MHTLFKIFSSYSTYLKSKSLTFTWIFFTVTLLFFQPTLSAAQTNYYVSPDGDNVEGTNTCLNTDEPCATIAYAISEATVNSTIHLAAGEYTEPGLVIDKVLTIQGNDQSDTFIQGHPEDPELATNRVLHINQAGNVVLRDFTVRHGRVTGNTDGGGIYVNNTPVELVNVTISHNSAGRNGAGIYLTASQAAENPANFTNVTIRENAGATSGAGQGGGIYINNVISELTNTDIEHNSARTGGGLYMTGSAATEVYLLNSKINNNESMGEGGGVRMGTSIVSLRMEDSEVNGNKAGVASGGKAGGLEIFGNVHLENVTVSNNSVTGTGGGISFITSSATPRVMTLKNVTISGNSATGDGGGIFIINNIADLSNVQITGNQSGNQGGGVHLSFGNTEFYMVNSVVSNNKADLDSGGLHFSGGANTPDYSLVNSVISNNTAKRNGGGITIGAGTTLTNVTVSGNQAENVGGGLWIFSNQDVNITNSILWGNFASRENDPGHEMYHQHTATTLSYSIFKNEDGDIIDTSGNLSIDNPVNLHPRYINPPDDLSVNQNSPAINAGDPDTDLSLFPFDESDNPVDLAGNPRVFNDRIDIGAYEFQGDFVTPVLPDTPLLSTPENGADEVVQPVTLQWLAAEHADGYRVQLQTAGGDFSVLLFDEVTEETGITLPVLDELTEFEWRVQALTGPYDESDWSAVWSFTTSGLVPPDTVVLIAPENGAVDVSVIPILTWQAVSLAASYRLQVSLSGDFASTVVDQAEITSTEYEMNDLEYETIYYWRVRATNDAGDGEWSEAWSFTTVEEPSSPPGIVNLNTPVNGADDVSITPTLSWQTEPKAESYRLQVSLSGDFASTVVDQAEISSTEYEMNDLEYETIYYWRVRATNDAGDGEWSEAWSFTTVEEPSSPPGIVILISPEDGATDISVSPLLIWQELQNADSYTLQVSAGAEFTSTVLDQSGIEATSFQASGLELNSTYYWRVRGVNDAGPGDWSEVWSFTTGELSPPSNLSLAVTNNAPVLSWELSPSSSVTGYYVYRGPAADMLELLVELNASAAGYTDDEAPEGGTFYAVRAVASGGLESAFTEVVNFFKQSLSLGSQWQLISHSVTAGEPDVSGSLAYGYNRVYQNASTLNAGKGYWIKNDNGANLVLAGQGNTGSELELNAGWNLVGGLSGVVPVAYLEDPSAILSTAPVFGYNGSMYQTTDDLLPGSGYWLHAETAGVVSLSLNLDPSVASGEENPLAAAAKVSEGGDKLIFTSGELSTEFAIYRDPLTRDEKYRYLMPPMAPDPVLDVRTGDGFRVMDLESAAIQLRAASYPVTLRLESPSQDHPGFILLAEDDAGNSHQWPVSPGIEILLSEAYSSLTLNRAGAGEMISETVLEPGYPNPFNPATNIRYRLSQQAEVTVEVYDIGGRRISTLVNQTQQPGAYSVPFDGSGLASGIYLIRLQAGAYTSIQKLTLIK
jgi:hypothetical protein